MPLISLVRKLLYAYFHFKISERESEISTFSLLLLYYRYTTMSDTIKYVHHSIIDVLDIIMKIW